MTLARPCFWSLQILEKRSNPEVLSLTSEEPSLTRLYLKFLPATKSVRPHVKMSLPGASSETATPR